MNSQITRRRRDMRWAPRAMIVLAFGFALLAAQVIVFTHDLDVDSHLPGHVCDVCVLSADLAGANVAPVPVLGVFSGAHSPAAAVPMLAMEQVSVRPSARGPPQTS
jgi:hypothetical protein